MVVRLEALEKCQVELKVDLARNTAVTEEVRDILTTFKTLGAFAKWSSAIIAAVAGAWIAIKNLHFWR